MSANVAGGVYCATCHKRRPAAHFTERPDHVARATPARSHRRRRAQAAQHTGTGTRRAAAAHPRQAAQMPAAALDGAAPDRGTAAASAWSELDAADAAEWEALAQDWDTAPDVDSAEAADTDADASASANDPASADAPAGSPWGLLAGMGLCLGALATLIGIPAALGTWQARRDAQATTQGAQDGRGW